MFRLYRKKGLLGSNHKAAGPNLPGPISSLLIHRAANPTHKTAC